MDERDEEKSNRVLAALSRVEGWLREGPPSERQSREAAVVRALRGAVCGGQLSDESVDVLDKRMGALGVERPSARP